LDIYGEEDEELAVTLLKEMLELIDDEENFVRIEAITVLSNIIGRYSYEQLIKANAFEILREVYAEENAEMLH